MAFPTVTATAVTTAGSTAGSTASVLMPATVNAGDILIAWVRASATGGHTWPAGWTEFFDESPAGTNQTSCAWKVAVGNEDGTTVNVTIANSKYSAIAYAIGGADTPECSTRAGANSNAPNPPSFDPSWGTEDTLWLWCGAWEGEQTSPPAGNPTNYTNPIGSSSGTAGAVTTNTRCASARRNLNAATEDPPSWTISVADDWLAWVIALRTPPPPAPGPGQLRHRPAHRFLVMR